MSVKDVMDKLSWYDKTLRDISRDEQLTEASRIRQFNNLAESKRLYGSTARAAFVDAWSGLRSEFDALDRARRAASQRAEDSWQYERVNYYSEQAKADVRRSASLPELEQHLKNIVASGSREQARAYLESSGAVVSKYHGDSRAGGLAAWMESEAGKLTRPAEFDKLDEREHELILQAVKLRDTTQAAANMAPDSGIGSLLRVARIGMRADSTSGNYAYTVAWMEPVTP